MTIKECPKCGGIIVNQTSLNYEQRKIVNTIKRDKFLFSAFGLNSILEICQKCKSK